MREQIVVCAACKLQDGTLICGPRHWDSVMRGQMESIHWDYEERQTEMAHARQGFVDQFGMFLTRREALAVVRESGQPFDAERNRSDTELFSEGLY